MLTYLPVVWLFFAHLVLRAATGQIIPLPTFCLGLSPQCTCAAEGNVVRFHCPDEYAMLLEVSEPGASLYMSYYASSELQWLPRFNISSLVKIEFDAYIFWPEKFVSELLETLGVQTVKTIIFRDRTLETVVTRDVLNSGDGYMETSQPENITTWHFGSVPGLKKFKFYSHLPELQESIFHGFDTLRDLHLSVNVTTLPGNMLSTVNGTLKTLTIESPGIVSFGNPLLRELQQLRNLSLALIRPSNERDKQLQSHFFGSMTNLEEVRLASATSSVNRTMFKGTNKLQLIKMNGNDDLMELPGEIFLDQVNLKTLDLSCNAIVTLHEDVFKGLGNLTLLDLSKNRLTNLSSTIFAPLTSLNVLRLNKNSLTAMSPSVFQDVVSLNYIEMVNTQFYGATLLMNYEAVVCTNDEACQYKSAEWQCDPRCICWVQRSIGSLIVDCRGTSLGELPDLPRTTLLSTVLKVGNNSLTSLPAVSEHSGYANVSGLFLSDNNLTTLGSGDQLPENLTHLDVRGNQIQSLSEEFILFLQEPNNTMTLSLSGNPISCGCESLSLLFFVRTNPQRVRDIADIVCTKQKKAFQQMEAFELCPSYVLLISCVVGGLVIVICLLTVFYLMFQQELKIWMYNNNLCLWWVSEEELDKDKTYDAFISYSHKDEELISKLLPKLESGPHPFRLCLHDRDWLVGDCIPEQIVRTVDDSKRVIIVLSQHFIDSVWARMEFRIAYQATLQDKRKRIIIILYRELEHMNGIDSELRAYLKLNTYLKWGDPLFWSKLCYAMPHNRRVLKGQKKHAGPLI
ncbi:protein toll [Drosophila simulans]|uniref:Tehao n=4 Tax=Drosophila simulans TaxID=7240 RepID=B4Q4U0_DROSI|nr:protein toll [Drosophila simulans]EDX04928.1 tehao [Drosophila simulans]KMY90109.1 tehao, isoform A [Drosophila simulans]